jgi:PHS family inorganic phosphate transporter-like MFS transporter
MLIILATILSITTPTGSLSPDSSLIYLGIMRILLGVGVGGDYPMSASITSDRSNLRKRGTMLAYIFANQGWGSLVGSLVFMIVLACYRHVMQDEGQTSKVDGVWRICVGLSLIPAFGTLYQRLTLAESSRFLRSREPVVAVQPAQQPDVEKKAAPVAEKKVESSDIESETSREPVVALVKKKAHFRGACAACVPDP